nr:class I histocompatibility antigen, F10 alpha chain-like isoform X2 [Pogona vitticeps]
MQWMYSCELREDRSKRGYIRDAYDGRDYLSFDLQTLTWTAADPKAQITKEKWEKDPAIAQRQKAYLEGICTEWLQRYLEYGKDSLLRRDRPVGKVTRKEGYDDRETLVCQAYGFYPKEIDVTWRKDGEVLQEGTFYRSVAPYPDGTYHAWLSIEIDPKERDWYQCHVDHASLGEPLILAWEAPVSTLGLILGCVIAVALLLLIVAGIVLACIYIRKLQDGYRTALKNIDLPIHVFSRFRCSFLTFLSVGDFIVKAVRCGNNSFVLIKTRLPFHSFMEVKFLIFSSFPVNDRRLNSCGRGMFEGIPPKKGRNSPPISQSLLGKRKGGFPA